jgi:hexosaminidase
MRIYSDYSALAILPQPVSLTRADGYFRLTSATVIVVDQQTQAVGRLLADTLAPALGFSLPVFTDVYLEQSIISLALDPTLTRLGNEGYTLKVTPRQVTLRANHLAGVFYATQTLRQLLTVHQ